MINEKQLHIPQEINIDKYHSGVGSILGGCPAQPTLKDLTTKWLILIKNIHWEERNYLLSSQVHFGEVYAQYHCTYFLSKANMPPHSSKTLVCPPEKPEKGWHGLGTNHGSISFNPNSFLWKIVSSSFRFHWGHVFKFSIIVLDHCS